MKNRLSAILIVFSLLIGILFLSSCKEQETPEEVRPPETEAEEAAATITRGQWITMLAEAFGVDSYQSESPYFKDIAHGDPLFSYVQAAAEWAILSDRQEDVFGADNLVTWQEVASTSAVAAGYSAESDVFDANAAVSYAIAHGIVPPSTTLTNNPLLGECEAVIDAAKRVYLSAPIDEKIIVDANDSLINFGQIAHEDINIEQGQVTLSGNVSEFERNGDLISAVHVDTGDGISSVGVGSVFVTAPTELSPFGTAYKVSAISESTGNAILLTEAPTLDDLYNDLIVRTTVDADINKIIWADGILAASANGVSWNGNSNEYHINLLSTNGKQPQVTKLDNTIYTVSTSKDFEFASGDYSKTWTGKNSSVLGESEAAKKLTDSNFVYDRTPSVDDFKNSSDSWTEKLKTENKFSSGYKITGTITINAITVTADVEYHKFDVFGQEIDSPLPESATLQVTSDIDSALKIEGNLSERLKIATIPIPIGATGLTVSVDLYLYADASGSLQVQATMGSSAKAEWESPAKLKHLAEAHTEIKTEAAIEIDFGAEVAASLDAFAAVTIIDMGVKCGGQLTADAYLGGKCTTEKSGETTTITYIESMTLESNLFVPLVSLYIGKEGSLIKEAGISKTWDISTKEDGARTFNLIDEEWEFWREVVMLDKDGNVISSETTTAGKMEREYNADLVYSEMLRGDFSYFAGTYTIEKSAGYYQENEYPDIRLEPNGTIIGGIQFSWSSEFSEFNNSVPLFIRYQSDGTFDCVLVEREQPDGWPPYRIHYIIYPAGVVDPLRPTLDNTKTRILYLEEIGGVLDAYYIKAD